MQIHDAIVEEVHRVRDVIAAECGDDLRQIAQHAQRRCADLRMKSPSVSFTKDSAFREALRIEEERPLLLREERPMENK